MSDDKTEHIVVCAVTKRTPDAVDDVCASCGGKVVHDPIDVYHRNGIAAPSFVCMTCIVSKPKFRDAFSHAFVLKETVERVALMTADTGKQVH